MTSVTTARAGIRNIPWQAVAAAVTATAFTVGVKAATTLSAFDAAAVSATLVTAAWWVGARHRRPAALHRLSLAALGLVAVARIGQGPQWQMVPWQFVAVTVAASAALRMWRPDRTHRWTRAVSRTVLVLGVMVGTLGLGVDPVPTLPQPSGPFQVGSQLFHWSDSTRPEHFTIAADDVRQVVAQAWYPAAIATDGRPTAYVESDPPARLINTMPAAMFTGMAQVDTHATDLAPVDGDRTTWPVLIFSPGLWVARQSYTALATELASRGYVVVTLSHAYDSPATLLADGTDLDTSTAPRRSGVPMAEQLDIRAADVSFTLDQLTRLADSDPASPLAGRLDLDHVGVLGHSLGGATAAQVLGSDRRFLAGLNIDGRLFDHIPQLDRPFLWLQSGGSVLPGRDALLDGLRGGGALVTVAGSAHMGFSDTPAYLTPTGRAVLGSIAGTGSTSVEEMAPITADIVTAFFGPVLGGPSNGDLAAAAGRNPSVSVDRDIAAAA